MSDGPPRGGRVWLLVALPLVAQLAFTLAASGVLHATGLSGDGDIALTSLPEAIVLLASYGVFLLAIVAVARALGEPRALLALRRVPPGRGIGLAALGLLAGLAIAAALEPIFHGQASQPIAAGDVTGPASALALAISIVTVVGAAALCEELYFRGLLYGRIDARLGALPAAVASAGVFGLAHFEPAAFPALFALGLILGALRWRTGSIWPGVGLHAANNALAVGALLVAAR